MQRYRSVWSVLIAGLMAWSASNWTEAAETVMRSEFTLGGRWVSETYTYDHYVVNGESTPGVSSRLEQRYQELTAAYRFDFTPVREDPAISLDLRRFYAHPSMLRLHLAVQPEYAIDYHATNRDANYRSDTFTDHSARGAGADLEWYGWENTGFSAQIYSLKREETFTLTNSLDLRGAGESNELRRQYVIGVSHYLNNDLNVRLLYTFADEDAVSVRETDVDVQADLTLRAEYIVSPLVGLEGSLTYRQQDSHSVVSASYYDNFPSLNTYYDDETTVHAPGLALNLYLRPTTTWHLGGNIRFEQIDRAYEGDQTVTYDWQMLTLQTNFQHDFTRRLGLEIGYAYTRRHCEVDTRHPASADNLGTTFEADADAHGVSVALSGRF